jgi:apolipoprotein N-acyltransferase
VALVIVRALAAAAAGVVASTAFPPASLPLLPVAMAVVFGLIAASRGPREAFLVGAAAAIGLFSLHILWLPASFSVLLGGVFWLLFPALLAALAAIWGATAAALRWAGGGGAGTLLLTAPAWILVEWLRGLGFLGFPWGSLGYGWLGTPVAQWADLVGVHGLGLLAAAAAAALAAPFVPAPAPARTALFGGARRTAGSRSGAIVVAAAAVGLVAAAWVAGEARGARVAAALPAPDRTALLVQGDVDPFGRAVSAAQELDVHVDLTSAAVAASGSVPDLVVWPEGAVLGFPLEGFRGEPARTAIQAAAPGAAFVVGGRARVEGGGANAVYGLADGEITDRYDKHVLVPFGERWPWLDRAAPVYRAVFGLFGLPLLQNTVPGPGPAPLLTADGPVAAYVCYESVFARIPRTMVAAGAEVLINVTNDAWFARGSGAEQHFEMGRLRALETRRWLLRAGNDGITGVIDPAGVVRDRLDRGVRGTLEVAYARSDALTPYVRYGALTPWLLLIATGASWLGSLRARPRR